MTDDAAETADAIETHDEPEDGPRERARTTDASRRSVLRGMGAVAAAGALSIGSAQPTAAAPDGVEVVDDLFDLTGTDPIEAIVVFDSRDGMSRLLDLDLAVGYHEYEFLPMTYTALTPAQIERVADWMSVRRIRKAVELEYYNDDAREAMGVDAVQSELDYDGSAVDVAVIDSGFSGPHPDFEGRIESSWQWVDGPLGEHDADWLNAGSDVDTDDLGHGTHCSGIIGGDGSQSEGTYRGMAPATRLSVYSTNETQYLPYAIGAWDHLLARAADDDVAFSPDVVSNSYGVARDIRYNPNDPLNVATWAAFTRGILPVFAAGNDGPSADTLSRFAKAPHVLCVAATNDEKAVTDFSSRGRLPDEDRETNYDRKEALKNLEKFHDAMTRKEKLLDSGSYSGTLGPTGSGSAFHEWDAPKQADVLELTLSLTPDGEQITLAVHEGSKDGPAVAKLGEEPVYQHYTLTTDVEGGTTYWIELEPSANVAVEYEVEEQSYREAGNPNEYRPVGLYRPGVATPGNSVMSTIGPTDPLDALEPDDRAYYSPMTGTSMACPAAAGVATLAVDAARKNGHDPDPIDILNTIEATAVDVADGYEPWNAGAGFVDAKAAVQRVEAGDFASFSEVALVDDT